MMRKETGLRIDKTLLAENIEKAIAHDLAHNKVFGSAYCVMQNDEVVFRRCVGHASPAKTAPITDKTLFRLASMTKPITAAAMLILVDRGLVKLDDPVSRYLPIFENIAITECVNGEFVEIKKPQAPPTVLSLLTHSSGIDDRYDQMVMQDKQTVADTVEFLARVGLAYEPHSRQQYSGFGAFDVAVAIIEKVSGEDCLTFLKREIFDPCGMVDTTFTPTAEQWSRMVAMHNRLDGENVVGKTETGCIFADFPATHYLGGAGLVSTLYDYTRFAQMLLHKGETAGGRLMREETFALMNQPHVQMWEAESWGLGVRVVVGEEYADLPVGDFGWSGAYGTHFWVDPQNQITAVFLKNSHVDGGSGNESARLFERAVSGSFVR